VKKKKKKKETIATFEREKGRGEKKGGEKNRGNLHRLKPWEKKIGRPVVRRV